MFLREKLSRNKTVLANFSYLSILQAFAIVFPLLTYPYLLRVIGLEKYGVIIFAQTIVTYVSLVINFGFNMSGVRTIAIYKDDKEEISKIVSSIYLCKFVLWCICLLIYMIVISIVPFFREYYWVYFFSFFLTLNELLLPIWFFQGIEKMKYVTIVNLSARSLFVGAIFLLVKNKNDFLYVPMLNGIGAILAGVIAVYIVIKKENVKLSLDTIDNIKLRFKESLPLFISLLSTQIYVNVNKLVVGSFLGMSEVSIYDLGEKVLNLMKLPILMASQAIFPKISRERNIYFINKVMFLLAIIAFVEYLVMFLVSKKIVYLFTGGYVDEAVVIVRILGVSAIVVAFNSFLGVNRLALLGFASVYMRIMICNCLFFMLSLLILLFANMLNMYTVSLIAVITEVFSFIMLFIENRKRNLL